jgi:lipopolysaccharide export system protein LptA
MSRLIESGRPLRGRPARSALALTLLALCTAIPAGAQQISGNCTLSDNFRTIQSQEITPGVRVVWIGLPDLRCPNGLRIRADSAVIYEQTGRNELIGNVRFTTPERDLRSDIADWYEREGQLLARGRVVFGDLTEGTEVRGESLDFLEGRPGREEQVTVSGGRPTATLPAEAREDGTAGIPFQVTANRLRFQGERFFWGDGEVEVEREDLRAQADSLVYDRDAEFLVLNRNAEVVRGEVMARGENLNLTFSDDRLRTLVARNRGRIETGDYSIAGMLVEVSLDEEEELESILAEGGEDPETGDAMVATLEGDNLFVRGGRIQVSDAEEGMRILTASGSARAEALGDGFGTTGPEAGTPDPTDAAPVADDPVEADPAGVATLEGGDLAGLADRDWIEGEEITALFEATTASEEEPEAEDGWRLVRLESTTNAAALYRTESEEETAATDTQDAPGATPPDPDAPPADMVDAPGDAAPADAVPTGRRFSISYVLADRIVIYLEDGEVSRLEAEGNVRGLQLEPREGGAG